MQPRQRLEEPLACKLPSPALPSAVDADLPQLAIAWVLQNPNVSAALVGASRPEQLDDTVKASGVTLDADTMAAIDAALGSVAETDPALTEESSPPSRP